MATTTRQSKQRTAIMDILINTTSHPTAEMVFQEARKRIPDISLGTVYRNLNFLADHNMIRRVKSIDQTIHFDGNLQPHYHFFCQHCGEIFDYFPDTTLHQQLIDCMEKTGVKVNYSRVNFVGLCQNCLKEENL